MPRVTNAQAAARREKVGELWVRGVSLTRIAATLRCDWETAKRDVVLLGKQAAAETDLARELHRLLLGGRAVEVAGWQAGQLGQVLAAQKQVLGVLQALQGLDVEARLEVLEQRLAELTGDAGGASHGGALNGTAAGRGGVP